MINAMIKKEQSFAGFDGIGSVAYGVPGGGGGAAIQGLRVP